MPKVYFTGGTDRHAVKADRHIQFSRCDDDALPYAEVTDEELAALVADESGLYAAGALPCPLNGACARITPDPEPQPPKTRGRKPAVEG